MYSSSPSSPTTLSSLISSFPIEQSVKVVATAKIILIAIPLASVAAFYLFNTIATTTFIIGVVFWLRYLFTIVAPKKTAWQLSVV
jgi:hypothetical protein